MFNDRMDNSAPGIVSVGGYLARRLLELGGAHLFGLPGDFNLTLLDEMLAEPGLEWVGTTNELNAAYAADGYARTKRGVAGLVTTYGVGELSAINGVAGSFAEDVPVVQITGMPSTAHRVAGTLLHHTLVDGEYDHFFRAYREVTAAGATLRAQDAGQQIDRVLRTALEKSKPVYLGVPMDVAAAPIPAAPLARPLRPSRSDEAALAEFEAELATVLGGQRTVTLLAGPRIHRRRAEGLLERIAGHTGVRVATQASSKAMLSEAHPASLGIYMGAMTSSAPTRDAVDGAGVLVLAGTVLSDVLTGFFSQRFDLAAAIELGISAARIGPVTFHDIRLEDSLAALDRVLDGLHLDPAPPVSHAWPYRNPPATGDSPDPVGSDAGSDAGSDDGSDDRSGESAPLTQDRLWRIVQDWLPGNMIAIADAGTALYGALELQMPAGTELLASPIWSSIGYTLPATLGTGLAAPDRRSVLFIGDGAAQLTATELATILHRGLTPIIVLINNDGYTIERVIQSPDAVYQQVTRWDWAALPAALAPGIDVVTGSVRTGAELRAALADALVTTDRAVLLEVKLDRDDAPALLATLGRMVATGAGPDEDGD